MKKVIFLALAAASILTLVSCNKDDEKTVPAAEVITGTYNGTCTLSVMGTDDESTEVFVITKVDDNTVTLTTPEAGEGAMSLPAITTSNLSVTRATVDGKEVIKASSEKISGTITVNGEEKSYNFTELAIVGNGTAVSISYSLQYGRMPMAMNFSFIGNK